MVQVHMDQAISARGTYLGLQAAVIGLMAVRWACLVGQLPQVQWLVCGLVTAASPLLYVFAACAAVCVPGLLLVCLLAGGRLEETGSVSATAAWLWRRLRAGVHSLLPCPSSSTWSLPMSARCSRLLCVVARWCWSCVRLIDRSAPRALPSSCTMLEQGLEHQSLVHMSTDARAASDGNDVSWRVMLLARTRYLMIRESLIRNSGAMQERWRACLCITVRAFPRSCPQWKRSA